MAGKKEPGTAWRQTSVLVRADIFEQAQAKGIDLSDACNRALADLLGIDYRQQQLNAVPAPAPVIIAKDGGPRVSAGPIPAAPGNPMVPVINADDPAAAGAIATIKKQPKKRPAPAPELKHPEGDTTAREQKPTPEPVPAKSAPAKKAPLTLPKRPSRGDGLKKFIAAAVIREDAPAAVIGKEEFYQIFARWCRDHKVSPVPEEKAVAVALKTRFAFPENVVDSRPCWTSVRFR
jgi:hypothetical protein